MKKSAAKSKTKPARKSAAGWKLEKWKDRCAWCSQRFSSNAGRFKISIRLRAEAFQEFEPGTVQPLLLYQAGKTVPMLVVSEGSAEKEAGKDALFRLCSEKCAQALQTALRAELEPGADASAG